MSAYAMPGFFFQTDAPCASVNRDSTPKNISRPSYPATSEFKDFDCTSKQVEPRYHDPSLCAGGEL
eukprot:887996-Ditylum_brightwellii.AAC.1